MSINTRGMSEEIKRRSMFKYCRDRADIIFLQETHSTKKSEKQWLNEWGGEIIFNHGSSDARGVCILFKRNIECKLYMVQRDLEGRILNVEIAVENKKYSLTNVYGPNVDTPVFFINILELLKETSENKIVMGDFNCALNPSLDRLNTTHNNYRSAEIIEKIMEEYYLSDIWRIRNPDTRHYTWIKRKTENQDRKASRIDYALVSKGTIVENTTHVAVPNTDHRAVYLSIKTSNKERGSGYWKLNVSLLKETEFLNTLGGQIEKDKHTYASQNPIKVWERNKENYS